MSAMFSTTQLRHDYGTAQSRVMEERKRPPAIYTRSSRARQAQNAGNARDSSGRKLHARKKLQKRPIKMI